jgi:glyoxylase-like metal-dependent hydrolase (beta-lactamase superfamily II)
VTGDMTGNVRGLSRKLKTASGLHTITLGEFTITHLPDGYVQLRPGAWLSGLTDLDLKQLAEYLDGDGCLIASIGALLLEHSQGSILIDAGIGPVDIGSTGTIPALGKLQGGQLLDHLRDAAIRAPISALAFTHLHDDHVGWALRGEAMEPGGPLSNAQLVIAEPEARAQNYLTKRLARDRPDRVKLILDGETIAPGISVRILPGHTPGSAIYEVNSAGERLVILGDLLHTSAQVTHPEWAATLDWNPELGVRARKQILSELANDAGAVAYGGHFSDFVFGRVRWSGASFQWEHL